MKTRAVVLAASVTVGLLLSAPAAQAQTWRHTDATGDATVTRYDDDGELTEPEVDPRERRNDITHVTATYGARSLRVAVSVRSQEMAFEGTYVTVRSSRGHTYRIVVEYFMDRYLKITRNGYRYECAGLTSNRTRAGYVVTVPRSCFDGAYRIRLGVQTYGGTDGGDHDEQAYDDFLRVGEYVEGRPFLSPWIVGA